MTTTAQHTEPQEEDGKCDTCDATIKAGTPYSCDDNSGMTFCVECSPTWQNMLDEPESFYDAEGEYLTPEQGKAKVDAHLANGGKLTDRILNR